MVRMQSKATTVNKWVQISCSVQQSGQGGSSDEGTSTDFHGDLLLFAPCSRYVVLLSFSLLCGTSLLGFASVTWCFSTSTCRLDELDEWNASRTECFPPEESTWTIIFASSITIPWPVCVQWFQICGRGSARSNASLCSCRRVFSCSSVSLIYSLSHPMREMT